MARRLTPTEKLSRESDQFNSVHELDEKKIAKIADPKAQAYARAAMQRHQIHKTTGTGEVFKADDGNWSWHVKTAEGKLIARGSGLQERRRCQEDLRRVRRRHHGRRVAADQRAAPSRLVIACQ